MQKKTLTRIKALAVGAVMAATSLSAASVANLFATAAGDGLPKTLATSISGDDPDTSINEEESTYKCLAATSQWDSWTDTAGTGPETLLGTSNVTSLKFHFEVPDEYQDEYVVSQFTYYFGCAASKKNGYWWDIKKVAGDSIECHPYSNAFDVVLQIPSSAQADFTDESGKFQIQNCYTQLISTVDKKTIVEKTEIVLTEVTANAPMSEDTSEASDEVKAEYATTTDGPRAAQNTGGLWYSSILYTDYDGANGEYYDFVDNGDGTATIKTLNALKIDDVDLELTPGDNCSEEYYMNLDPEKYTGEDTIRADGQPINSHKFTFGDFGLNAGVNSGTTTTIKSLSVTLSSNDVSVNRIMYGGGINVEYMSPADTEYAKHLVGLKEGANVGYWYNDIGSDVYQQVLAKEEESGEPVFSIATEGGSDLAKQEMGSYFTVTWDVPKDVQPYVNTANTDSISFQLWYVEPSNEITSLNIESAVLTYEESITVPYTATAETSVSGTHKIGESVEIPYADFGMEYEDTADVYAVKFDITTNTDVNLLQVGGGTNVLDILNIPDNWYQFEDQFGNGKVALVNYEETTVENRPDPSDSSAEIAPYQDANGRRTYTFVWLMQTGIQGRVSTEQVGDHLSIGAYYGNLGETEASTYTIDNVTVYYKADDENNSYKTVVREGDLVVSPESMLVIEGTSSQPELDADGNATYDEDYNVVVGEDAVITVNVEGCTASSSMAAVQIEQNADGNFVVSAKGNSAGVSSVITITTPGGQTATVDVTVVSEVDPDKPEETTPVDTTTTPQTTTTAASTTTTAATTTTTPATTTAASTTTTTDEGEVLPTLYGDVTLDGDVNMADVILLNKYTVSVVDLVPVALANADVYYDSYVDGNDAMMLLRFQVQLVSAIGPGADL